MVVKLDITLREKKNHRLKMFGEKITNENI
jgi:hypothetical protein